MAKQKKPGKKQKPELSIEVGQPDKDGRRAERIPFAGSVELRGFFAGGKPRQDKLADVSPMGVFVETAQLLDVGDPVVVSFSSASGKRFSVSGRVRWVTPFGDIKEARPGMGIELVGVEGTAKDALKAMLLEHLS